MEEIWKPIKGYASWYEVSSLGKIRTHNWKGSGRTKIMKPAFDKKGYLRTMLKRDDGKTVTIKVHRIVASIFIPNPSKKPQVNHKNCVKTDNRVNNLEWVTGKENHIHAVNNGLILKEFIAQQKSGKNQYTTKKAIPPA